MREFTPGTRGVKEEYAFGFTNRKGLQRSITEIALEHQMQSARMKPIFRYFTKTTTFQSIPLHLNFADTGSICLMYQTGRRNRSFEQEIFMKSLITIYSYVLQLFLIDSLHHIYKIR